MTHAVSGRNLLAGSVALLLGAAAIILAIIGLAGAAGLALGVAWRVARAVGGW